MARMADLQILPISGDVFFLLCCMDFLPAIYQWLDSTNISLRSVYLHVVPNLLIVTGLCFLFCFQLLANLSFPVLSPKGKSSPCVILKFKKKRCLHHFLGVMYKREM